MKDQARLQLRDQLQITEAAKIMQQERLNTLTQNGTNSFSDVQQHWASEQTTAAYQWGFTNGYQDGTFQPNGTISGMEGIIMASRLINCTTGAEAASMIIRIINITE